MGLRQEPYHEVSIPLRIQIGTPGDRQGVGQQAMDALETQVDLANRLTHTGDIASKMWTVPSGLISLQPSAQQINSLLQRLKSSITPLSTLPTFHRGPLFNPMQNNIFMTHLTFEGKPIHRKIKVASIPTFGNPVEARKRFDFACDHHNDYPHGVGGNIYLIQAVGSPRYKIGLTAKTAEERRRQIDRQSCYSHPGARINSPQLLQSFIFSILRLESISNLRAKWEYPYKVLSCYLTANTAREEASWHDVFETKRVHGEWFELSLDQVMLFQFEAKRSAKDSYTLKNEWEAIASECEVAV